MMNDSSNEDILSINSSGKTKAFQKFIDKIIKSSNYLLFSSKSNESQHVEFKVYKIRWFILIIICLANVSNATSWTSLSSIANYAAKYYDVGYDSINLISSLYLFISIAPFILVFFLIDTYGIRLSIYLGVVLNFIGSLLKLLTTSTMSKSSKFPFLILGQISCSLASPLIAFISTKFANNWFPVHQRVIANTIAIMSNSFGVLFGAFVSALVVNDDIKYPKQINYLNILNFCLSILPLLLMGFIQNSNPPTPPSFSAAINEIKGINEQKSLNIVENVRDYSKQFIDVFKSRQFILLALSFGIGTGLLSALVTLIEQILCVRGYSDIDAGLLSGILILSGIIGSIFVGILLDKTKRFEELSKVCIGISTIWNTLFVILQMYNNDEGVLKVLLFTTAALLGFSSIPLIPVCLELAVECTYPIPEGTSSGILLTLGNAIAVLMVFIYPKIGFNVAETSYNYQIIQKCLSNSTDSNQKSLQILDYNYPLYGQSLTMFILSILFILFFKCPNLRLLSEQQKHMQQILKN